MLKWPLIDKDDSKDLLVSHPTSMGDQDANVAAYRIMFRTAQTQLENGIPSILDSPMARVELYHQAVDSAPKVWPYADSVQFIQNSSIFSKSMWCCMASSSGLERMST